MAHPEVLATCMEQYNIDKMLLDIRGIGSCTNFEDFNYLLRGYIVIRLTPEAVLPGIRSTDEVCFPVQPKRCFHEPPEQGYSCTAHSLRPDIVSLMGAVSLMCTAAGSMRNAVRW